jgi:hypothetical protein
MQEHRLLPLSPRALRFYELTHYNDYKGLASRAQGQGRLVQRLGDYPGYWCATSVG